jgi:hypothetical protein
MNSRKPSGGEGAAGAQPRKERPTSKQRPDRSPSADIPRGLVEQYCRAIGIEGPPSAIEDEGLVVWVVGQTGGKRCSVLGYRLGLCAAAERLIAEVHGPAAMTMHERAIYRDMLRLAGIDPNRWETARRG